MSHHVISFEKLEGTFGLHLWKSDVVIEDSDRGIPNWSRRSLNSALKFITTPELEALSIDSRRSLSWYKGSRSNPLRNSPPWCWHDLYRRMPKQWSFRANSVVNLKCNPSADFLHDRRDPECSTAYGSRVRQQHTTGAVLKHLVGQCALNCISWLNVDIVIMTRPKKGKGKKCLRIEICLKLRSEFSL